MIALTVLLATRGAALAAREYAELDPARIDTIAAMLAPEPAGFGKPASDRATWEDPAIRQRLSGVMQQADALLNQPFPAFDDEAYLEFSRIGQRPHGEAMLRSRDSWLGPLVLAECLENKGRFLPALDLALNAYARQTSWTLPAHDASLENFHGVHYSVDLHSSAFSHQLGEALYLMGERIAPETRKRVLDSMTLHVFDPMHQALRIGKGEFWLTADHNWNSVCLAGVTGAALSVLPERNDRAVFVAAAEHYSRHYLSSFTPDGYCAEGVGYWNYGFGAFATLREELVRSTAGRIDLFSDPHIRNMAMYGLRIQMINGCIPPFSDCRFGSRVSDKLLEYCNQTLDLKLPQSARPIGISTSALDEACMSLFPGPAAAAPPANDSTTDENSDKRWFFRDAGVLVSRPEPGSTCQMAVAIKSGGNGNHSHNDVGSFVIALGNDEPLGDPGGPVAYDNKTFSKERYILHKSLNSFGHPVPVVAGQLQRPATEASPKVLRTRFTDTEDEIQIDMSSAYLVPSLKELTRTMRYSRQGTGSVTIEDHVAFSSPQTFEMSLPTHGQWHQTDPKTIEFTLGKAHLIAEIETPDGFDLTSEVVEELSEPPFSRLGIKLKKPITEGVVRIVLHPAP